MGQETTLVQGLGLLLLTSITAFITWWLRSRLETIRKEREKMQEARREVYMKILNPYISMFSNTHDQARQQKAMKEIASPAYRRAHFEFNLIGSDECVKAVNDMVVYFRKIEGSEEATPKDVVKYWGGILLAVRKDLGNKDTKLDSVDMLTSHITDIDRVV